MSREKILVVQAAALGYEFLVRCAGKDKLCGLQFRPAESVFPAVTATVQASFRTGETPSSHGMIANGFYSRELGRPFFWEQSSSLVSGERIWKEFRRSGHTVGQLFWQQSLGVDSDVILSPAPIHKHHGGMIQDCFARPEGLYRDIAHSIGRPFNLKRYWGPGASVEATAWITAATIEVMRSAAPDLLLSYLPHLDYELQRSGPASESSMAAFGDLKAHLEKLVGAAGECGYSVLILGDYAMSEVSRAVFPNRALREEGLLTVRKIKGMAYPDLHTSRAFCVADHQTAHVMIKNAGDTDVVRAILEKLPGVSEVAGDERKRELGIDHPRSGELVLIAGPDAWFAYPWWGNPGEAPEYAAHVDIHSKPGYDPCELFADWWPFSVSTDVSKVRGSHGLVGDDRQAAWATNIDMGDEPSSVIGLSRALKNVLERDSGR